MTEVTLYGPRRVGPLAVIEHWISDRLAAPADWKLAYAEWRRERDIAAIARALDRLSDRQLALIGMNRDGLDSAAEALVERCEVRAQIGREVLALIATPSRVGRAPSQGG